MIQRTFPRAALAALLLLPLSLRAEEAAKPSPRFDVLRIAGADTTFLVVPEDEIGAKKSELAKKDKEAEAAWAAARDAFARDKANKGQPFLEPKPEPSKVSVAKAFPTETEAKQYADEEQRKAEGKYVVISVTGPNGRAAWEVVRQNKVKSREAELNRDFLKQKVEWQKRCDAWYAGQATVPPAQKQPFSETKPLQPKVSSRGEYASKEDAQKALQELEGKGKK